jgi:hypothetical protein
MMDQTISSFAFHEVAKILFSTVSSSLNLNTGFRENTDMFAVNVASLLHTTHVP